MKKVLALVLAVIMVCTMAMALSVGGKPVTSPDETETGMAVNPGTAIAITQADLDKWDIEYLTENGKLVPQIKDAKGKVTHKSTVSVSFGTGSALVASQGWVETADGWQYQIILKENDAMKLDEKVDLSFSQISYKNTGDLKAKVVKFNDADKTAGTEDDKILFDVGYAVVEVALDEDDVIDFNTLTDLVPDYEVLQAGGIARGVIVKVLKGDSETGSGHCIMPNTGSASWEGVIPVRAGETIFVSFAFDKDWTDKEEEKIDDGVGIEGVNPTAKPASVKVGEYTLLGWSKTTNIYAKNYRTGALVKLAVTMDDGVASFTVPAFSQVASFDGALAGATVETPADSTTTTNPGTGANDVVGVAAALAVVALVSGAAISLKK